VVFYIISLTKYTCSINYQATDAMNAHEQVQTLLAKRALQANQQQLEQGNDTADTTNNLNGCEYDQKLPLCFVQSLISNIFLLQ
jgi:hypothetical protein